MNLKELEKCNPVFTARPLSDISGISLSAAASCFLLGKITPFLYGEKKYKNKNSIYSQPQNSSQNTSFYIPNL